MPSQTIHFKSKLVLPVNDGLTSVQNKQKEAGRHRQKNYRCSKPGYKRHRKVRAHSLQAKCFSRKSSF